MRSDELGAICGGLGKVLGNEGSSLTRSPCIAVQPQSAHFKRGDLGSMVMLCKREKWV